MSIYIYILDCLTCFDIHKCDYAWFNFESTGLSLWTCICNTSYFLSNMKCLLPARLRCSHSVNSLSLKAGKYVAKNDSLSQGLDTAKFNGLSWFIMVYHGLSSCFPSEYNYSSGLPHFEICGPHVSTVSAPDHEKLFTERGLGTGLSWKFC